MNFFKRAFLYLWNYKGRSIALLLLLFIIGNLVLAALSIQHAVQQSSDWARAKLGTQITLKYDYIKAMESTSFDSEILYEFIPMSEVESLAQLNNVIDYHVSESYSVNPVGFYPVVVDHEDVIISGGDERQDHITMNEVLSSKTVPHFRNGTHRLVEGRHVTQEDTGKNVVLIEKTLGDKNHLDIGSEIEIREFDQSELFEVIGIYETSLEFDETSPLLVIRQLPWNQIYVPFPSTLTSNDDVQEAVFFFKSPNQLQPFINEAQEASSLDYETFSFHTSSDYYKIMAGPLEIIAAFIQTAILIVLFTGVVLLSLVIMLSVKGRMKELGVLLSLGESKGKALGQLMTETLVIVLLAFALAIPTGAVIGDYVGTYLIEQEAGFVMESTGSEIDVVQTLGLGGTERVEVIRDIDVQVSAEVILWLLSTGVLIALLSSALPTWKIVRLQPARILTKRD
ncbi:ABC transporter permease [Evansella tamaricis]|uniref:ABC transporter permease n=1 Tax=Evansella tamaricis TaxID=2069301 RepID=A0ABS6JJI5_9BACI|nr:ABC transporter permease [Evansella tamaricis]MBU9713830.1 ABC transporter permease [Evansella tamaricis]